MQSVLPEKRSDRRHNEEEGQERECRNRMGTMLRGLERCHDNIRTKPQQHTHRKDLCRHFPRRNKGHIP